MNVHGLIIDPQEDFCNSNGALYVPGAEQDMTRLAAMLHQIGDKISKLHVTLDSHHPVHIAHPVWWRDSEGNHPDPFTVIMHADVEAGRWRAARPETEERSRSYVAALERHGRYPLVIWPYHCLIGTPGHAVAAPLFNALRDWEMNTEVVRVVQFVQKGSNPFTEHYSALQADVPDPQDPATGLNIPLLSSLETADLVFVAGEAGSHCVANTVRDMVENASSEFARKVVLLVDAVSPVATFEEHQDKFLRDMSAQGMRVMPTTDFAALLG